MSRPLTVYLIAGEASGDMLGAGLMSALKSQTGSQVAEGDRAENIRFIGVGGERMAAQGLQSLFPYHELSLMGFAEILPHAIKLLARVRYVVEDIRMKKPDVVITIDSPGFNFRVVSSLHKEKLPDTKFIHYVAPSVWAYKPQRAKKCARLFDHLLTLLPFEPPYFTAEGLPATFVGHPVAYKEKGDGAAFRAKYSIPKEAKLICLLPGSRVTEIKRHLAEFAVAVRNLAEAHPGLAMVVPVHERFLPLVAMYFEGCPFRTVLLADGEEKMDAFAASDIALVKSGTVSLEIARAGVPQVVAYRTGRISAWLLKRMIKVRFANLINLILNREAIPELLQESCNAETLTNALEMLINDPARAQAQRDAAEEAFAQLRVPGKGANEAAAETILGLLKTA